MALLSAGYRVAVNGVREADALGNLLQDLNGEAPGRVMYVQGDIGRADHREGMLRRIEREFGSLNVLVNNAGVAPRERNDLLDLSEHSYDRVMDTNLKGPFLLTQAVAKSMLCSRRAHPDFAATIINIGSISATVASISRGQYCLSKAGMGMMTQLFATRLAPEGIGVYELRPGIIRTDMTSGVTEKYDKLIAEGLTLQPRWGLPEDVGRAVASLVRGDFAYSPGQVIHIDGGLTLPRL